jgi:hypothetical protein
MTIIFTRYLYDEMSVCRSLVSCLLTHKQDEALFWAFELYWSGFHQKPFDLLYQTVKIRYPDYKNLHTTVCQKFAEEGMSPTLLALFIQNICLLDKVTDDVFARGQLHINTINVDVMKYETVNTNMNYYYLPKVCLFPVVEETNEKNTKLKLDAFSNNWLFYASYSPIWKERILKLGGKINKRKKTVDFRDDDMFEQFHDEFGLEPEEQSKCLYRSCLGISL